MWSNPNPVTIDGYGTVSAGVVWMGEKPMTLQDWLNLETDTGERVVDPWSKVGRHHRDWSTLYDEVYDTDPQHKAGGKGSRVYEHQNLPDDVCTTREAIWHYNTAGELVKDIPVSEWGLGIYWKEEVGEYDYNVIAGVTEATAAELDGYYIDFDEFLGMWVVMEGSYSGL